MHPRSLLGASLLALALSACDEKADGTANTEASDCDGHGEWNEDHAHCHCDDGYSLSDGGYGCEPNGADEDDDSDDWQGDDTGEPESSFQPDTVEGIHYASSSVWVLTAKEGQTWLSIENYPDFGGATGPETVEIDATQANYATCGVCVMVQTGCEPHGDHAHCDATYMAEAGGSVTFDALGSAAGESWAGSLEGLRFVEVTIDSDTWESTPVDGGESIELNYWSFDVALEAG
jgi:hypothetical protein